MDLLGIATLALLLPFVVSLTVLGSSIKWILRAVAARTLTPPPLLFEDLPRRVILDGALGTSLIPLIYLLATILTLSITTLVVAAILAFAVLVTVLRLVRAGLPRIRSSVLSLTPERWEIVGLFVLGCAALAIRLLPYWGDYVYAGDDIRLYTLITQLVGSQGHFVTSFGTFGSSSWSVTTDNHLFFSGSEAVYAFSASWAPAGIPQLVSAGTLIFNAAILFSVYLLVRELFPDQSKWVAFSSAAVSGLVAGYPLFMIQWGGIDETMAWFLFPVLLAVLLALRRTGSWSWPGIVLAALLVAGLGAITPLGLLYVVAFLVPFLVETAVRREKLVATLGTTLASLGLGVVLLSPILGQAILNQIQTGAHLPPGSLGWFTFRTAPLFQPSNPGGDVNRFLTLDTGFDYSAVVVVLGFVGLLSRVRTRWVPTLLGWLFVLLALNENGPFGLYWIEYPCWGAVFPDRTAHLLFLPLSIGVGFVFGTLMVGATSGPPTPNPQAPPLPRRRIRSTASVVALACLIVATGIVVANTVPINDSTVQFETAVTTHDLAGFAWLQQHAAPGSTVLVNEADSGTWIPEFSGLRAFPYPELINNDSILSQYNLMSQQLANYNFSEFVILTHAYGLSYAFFGERWAGGVTNPIPPAALDDPAPAWTFVTADHLCRTPESNRTVNLTCTGDSVTFVGPVVLMLALVPYGLPVLNQTISIPSGVQFTYVLNRSTFAGANFTVVPLARPVYWDGNVLILQINSVYGGLATASAESP